MHLLTIEEVWFLFFSLMPNASVFAQFFDFNLSDEWLMFMCYGWKRMKQFTSWSAFTDRLRGVIFWVSVHIDQAKWKSRLGLLKEGTGLATRCFDWRQMKEKLPSVFCMPVCQPEKLADSWTAVMSQFWGWPGDTSWPTAPLTYLVEAGHEQRLKGKIDLFDASINAAHFNQLHEHLH